MKIDKNLIFLHIPKNGGNTLHSILDRIYPLKSTFSIKVINNIKLNTEDFINLPFEDRKKIKLLKGHMLFGLHRHLIGESDYITFLRKPEDRIISFYHYVKARPNHRLYKFITDNDYSLYDFVLNVNEGDVHNAQIRFISGLENGTEKEMLEKAMENIKNHFSFVGLQEQFNSSLVLLNKKYKWGVPYYIHQNKGNYKKEKLLDTKTRNAINELNKEDILLYQQIENEFKQLVKSDYTHYLKLWQLKFVNKLRYSTKLKSTYRKLRKIFF